MVTITMSSASKRPEEQISNIGMSGTDSGKAPGPSRHMGSMQLPHHNDQLYDLNKVFLLFSPLYSVSLTLLSPPPPYSPPICLLLLSAPSLFPCPLNQTITFLLPFPLPPHLSFFDARWRPPTSRRAAASPGQNMAVARGRLPKAGTAGRDHRKGERGGRQRRPSLPTPGRGPSGRGAGGFR